MGKPPSYFLLHFFNPHRVGIIIVCDFFRFKPTEARKLGFVLNSNALIGRQACCVKKSNELSLKRYAFFIPFLSS